MQKKSASLLVYFAALAIAASQAQTALTPNDLLGGEYENANTIEYFDNTIHWYTRFIFDFSSESVPTRIVTYPYDSMGFPLLGDSVLGQIDGTANKFKIALGGGLGDPSRFELRAFLLADVLYMGNGSKVRMTDGTEVSSSTLGAYGASGEFLLGIDFVASNFFSAGCFIRALDGGAWSPRGEYYTNDTQEYAQLIGSGGDFSRLLFPSDAIIPTMYLSPYYYVGLYDFKLNIAYEPKLRKYSVFFGRRLSLADPMIRNLVDGLGDRFNRTWWYRYITTAFGSAYFSLRYLAAGTDYFRPEAPGRRQLQTRP